MMEIDEKRIDSLSRERVRLGLGIALCFVVVLGGIAGIWAGYRLARSL